MVNLIWLLISVLFLAATANDARRVRRGMGLTLANAPSRRMLGRCTTWVWVGLCALLGLLGLVESLLGLT